jgi:hypothetical protein
MRGDRPTTRGIGVESRQATLTKNPLHASKAECDAWLDTELRSGRLESASTGLPECERRRGRRGHAGR